MRKFVAYALDLSGMALAYDLPLPTRRPGRGDPPNILNTTRPSRFGLTTTGGSRGGAEIDVK